MQECMKAQNRKGLKVSSLCCMAACMKTVALLARKGGAGKTTCAIHMGALAQADGQRVLFFDLDPQRSLATWWQSRPSETPPLIETDANRLAELLQEAQREGYE